VFWLKLIFLICSDSIGDFQDLFQHNMPVLSKMRRSTAGAVAALGAGGLAGTAFMMPTSQGIGSNPAPMVATMQTHANSLRQQGASSAEEPTVSRAALAAGAMGSLAMLSHVIASRPSTSRSSQPTLVSRQAYDVSADLGSMEPLGFFDPLGFSKGDEANFRNLRAAEIKHGRVSMMAAVGAVAQHYVKFPGFENVPAGMGAVTTEPGNLGFAALFLVSGALELGVWVQSPDREPGNFGDPLGVNQYNEEMRLKELNNGRFAMFAAAGIISADLYTGLDAVEQFGL